MMTASELQGLHTLEGFALFGLVPALIALGKGRSFFAWWIFAALPLMIIVALPLILLMRPLKRCTRCAEKIHRDAQICRHCREDLAEAGELLRQPIERERMIRGGARISPAEAHGGQGFGTVQDLGYIQVDSQSATRDALTAKTKE